MEPSNPDKAGGEALDDLIQQAEKLDIKPQEHPDQPDVTSDYVKTLTEPTDRFLCKLDDNWPKFKFGGFKIRDCVSNIVLVEVPEQDVDNDLSDADDPNSRVIKYHLGPEFLHLKTAGLTLNFKIGDKPIQNMEMVERHYFRGKVIRSYDFTFGFIIPNSANTWEFIYDLPTLPPDEMAEIIAAPYEVKSDSFFFAEGKLIIHNRAVYNYQPLS